MSIEYNPVGVTCNLSCPYCYEHPMRDAGNFSKPKDVEKVKEALLAEGHQFSVFGGEPLLADPDHLDEIWQFGLEHFGQNGIQTNGVLITDRHIEMFKKYKVYVGISLDGRGELNDSRWSGSLEKTRADTKKTLANIDKLIEHGIIPSLIITLHAGNARGGKLDKLKDWMLDLDAKGIKHIRLHALEIDHDDVGAEMALTDDENFKALITFHELERDQLQNIRFDVFADIRKLLQADDQSVTCVWNACDPYTTRAVHGVDANGDRHNCGRTNKDGVNWFKASQAGHERQLALYHTDWKDGGCKGCRFFAMCKGQCCGTGESADWRNKSDACWTWYRLFEYMERELLQQGEMPASLHPQRKQMEEFMIQNWSEGRNTNVQTAKEYVEGNYTPAGYQPAAERVVNSHGDTPHGDEHGDHTDQSLNN